MKLLKKPIPFDFTDQRAGLRIRCETTVIPEVKKACKDFCNWLRKEYSFPKRVVIYLKASERIKARDGEPVCGTFFGPFSMHEEPYIRAATGDYPQLLKERGQENALAAILLTIAHEIVHYFQWIRAVDMTTRGAEIQATLCAKTIVWAYAETCEHL